jgi:hypothetical protein
MSVENQKPEVKGATLHQEFARPDEQPAKTVQFDAVDENSVVGTGLKHMKDERVVMTDEQVSRQTVPSSEVKRSRRVDLASTQSRLVRRKIDRNILPILVW